MVTNYKILIITFQFGKTIGVLCLPFLHFLEKVPSILNFLYEILPSVLQWLSRHLLKSLGHKAETLGKKKNESSKQLWLIQRKKLGTQICQSVCESISSYVVIAVGMVT